MPARSTLKRTGAGLGPAEAAFKQLARKSVLVGIPSDSRRDPEPGEKGTPPSNGVIGYILETGDAEMNLPPRPFLKPGIQKAFPEITKGMRKAAVAALSARPGDVEKGLDEAGLAAVASVQQTMIAGGFAPLADRTIEARARRRYADTGKLVGTKPARDARSFLKLRAESTPDAVLHDAGLGILRGSHPGLGQQLELAPSSRCLWGHRPERLGVRAPSMDRPCLDRPPTPARPRPA